MAQYTPDTYWMEALIELPNGEKTTFSACYKTGERLPDGGVIVGFTEEFFYEQAEDVAKELCGDVLDVDHGRIIENPASLSDALDMF